MGRKLTKPDNKQLRALYTQLQTALGVAGHLGVSHSTARRWLSDAGIVMPTGQQPADQDDDDLLLTVSRETGGANE